MKIAFVLRRFPALSETFVLNQITGLIDRGHEVDIFAESARHEVMHPDVERYRLLERTVYWPTVPKQALLRWLKGLLLLSRIAVSRPDAAATALNVWAYGRLVPTMNLAYAGWPLLYGRRYDIIQCHFGENGILGMALRDMGLVHGALVTVFHGFDLSMDLRRRGTHVYSRLLRTGDLFLPVNERWRQRLIELGCPPDKLVVHRMGIDCGRFTLRARRHDAGATLRLVSVARHRPVRGEQGAARRDRDARRRRPVRRAECRGSRR